MGKVYRIGAPDRAINSWQFPPTWRSSFYFSRLICAVFASSSLTGSRDSVSIQSSMRLVSTTSCTFVTGDTVKSFRAPAVAYRHPPAADPSTHHFRARRTLRP